MECKNCKKDLPEDMISIECPECYLKGFDIERDKVIEKLEKFERYIRKLNFQYPGSKKNMIFNFHSIFKEEMKETETGKKWRKSIDGSTAK